MKRIWQHIDLIHSTVKLEAYRTVQKKISEPRGCYGGKDKEKECE
jgi:hypothetical protein